MHGLCSSARWLSKITFYLRHATNLHLNSPAVKRLGPWSCSREKKYVHVHEDMLLITKQLFKFHSQTLKTFSFTLCPDVRNARIQLPPRCYICKQYPSYSFVAAIYVVPSNLRTTTSATYVVLLNLFLENKLFQFCSRLGWSRVYRGPTTTQHNTRLCITAKSFDVQP